MNKALYYLKPHRRLLIGAVAFLAVQNFSSLYLLTLTAGIINIGVVNGDLDFIYKSSIIMLLVAVLGGAGSILSTVFSSRFTASFSRDLREAVFIKAQEYSLNDFQKFGTASMITRCTNDITILHHVRFGYQDDEILMHDINIHLNAGDKVAIVGPTGAGKTTLVNLLMQFYEIQGGRITIDGMDVKEMSRADLRSMFGMVLQDTWLFGGSIRDNIAYGNFNAGNEAIIAAAKAARVDHFIRTLPNGYHTILTEDGANLSQGQKQLLTIARALLANPTILILDEATSSVDTRTETEIQRALNNLMKGRTSFIIAHKLSTIRNADLILVMKDGTIIEQGTHRELLQQKGVYESLYNSQFA